MRSSFKENCSFSQAVRFRYVALHFPFVAVHLSTTILLQAKEVCAKRDHEKSKRNRYLLLFVIGMSNLMIITTPFLDY